jgi:creatinine amidohydrolase
MGKGLRGWLGLPGGRRQAGRIDYCIGPNQGGLSSQRGADRPCTARRPPPRRSPTPAASGSAQLSVLHTMIGSLSSEVLWQNLRAPQLRALALADATVFVPVGAMEQHGPHLPVQVDSLLATEVATGAAELLSHELGSPTVVTPTVWTGLSEHHMPLGGTFTLDIATYHSLLRGICRSVCRHGFRRIIILNGHGGNVTALSNISQELSEELETDVLALTYWTVDCVATEMESILEQQTGVLHAGEAESSMLMHLRPELVDERAR